MATFTNTAKSFVTGTGTVTSTGTAIAGSSTLFTTQLAVNRRIIIAGEARMITVITNNTSLTIDRALTGEVSGSAFSYEVVFTNIAKS